MLIDIVIFICAMIVFWIALQLARYHDMPWNWRIFIGSKAYFKWFEKTKEDNYEC